jgi:hypothetical protein
MPPNFGSWLAPGACVTTVVKSRPRGSRFIVSAVITVERALCLTSIIGDSALTDTTSAMAPTASVRSTVRIWPRSRSTLSILAGVKPSSPATTTYLPGRRPGTRKTPLPSVTAVAARMPVDSLVIWTGTPGSTAPDASLTDP